jgi:putative membrane protein
MKRLIMSSFAVATLLWGIGCSSSNTDTADTASTTETVAADSTAAAATDAATGATTTQQLDSTSFPIVAASSDMFEILSSTEAQTKATNAEVKKFAAQMVKDHTQTSTELKSIAGGKNILLPAAPLPMHQRLITALTAKEAQEFDETYMEQQVMAHQNAVSLFETASKEEADPELKAFAAKHLPHLQMHLDMARKTKDLVD